MLIAPIGQRASHLLQALQRSLLCSTETLRQACGPVAGALRVPLRELLHHHLGHDRLRTRQVWRGVQRLNEIPSQV